MTPLSDRAGGALGIILGLGYSAASTATAAKLVLFDCYVYNAWNWLIAVPVDLFLAGVWPIYWVVLRPLFGGGCH